jgi:hypothetical protein
MTFHLKQYIGPCLFLLALAAIAPSVADRLRTRFPLPAGYGAEGDRRRANPVPALVRPTVENLSAGSEGSWVGECVEDGAWVYELHVSRDGKESLIRLSSNGSVIPPEPQEREPACVVGAGG